MTPFHAQLAERGIDFQQVAAQAGKLDADPFDMLCNLAINAHADQSTGGSCQESTLQAGT